MALNMKTGYVVLVSIIHSFIPNLLAAAGLCGVHEVVLYVPVQEARLAPEKSRQVAAGVGFTLPSTKGRSAGLGEAQHCYGVVNLGNQINLTGWTGNVRSARELREADSNPVSGDMDTVLQLQLLPPSKASLLTALLKVFLKACALLLAGFIIFSLLESTLDGIFANLLGVAGGQRTLQNKCEVPTACPTDHFAFKMSSGMSNKIGPKICLEGNILIGGKNFGRGINVALVNGYDGKLIQSRSFDMYAGDVKDLTAFLKSIKEGTLVMMASFDDPATKLSNEARHLISDLGSSSIHSLSFRDSWIFVGGKWIEGKTPFEKRLHTQMDTRPRQPHWPSPVEMDGCVPQIPRPTLRHRV